MPKATKTDNKKKYELTEEGKLRLESELNELKTVKREEIITAIKEARAQGDLSENADYDAARNEQARIEKRITEIEDILKNFTLIKANDDKDVVNIGKTVGVKFLNKNNQIKEFQLVGTIEANPLEGKISIESPIGKAIIRNKVGDVVSVKSETGNSFNVEIVSIN